MSTARSLANCPCSGRDDVVPGMIAAIETWAMLIKRLYKIDPLACTPLTRQYLLN